MKKQNRAAKMDESLGMRRGKESTKMQSMSSRRHESDGSHHKDGHLGADHHHKEMKKHMSALCKMAKGHHKK